jgi:hypothetical protein
MSEYMPPQQALTRPRNDPFHAVDDMRITSYALRYYVNPPEANCPNMYPVEPTTRIQKHGGGYVANQWRTDVESDLKGITRLGQRVRAEDRLYNPETNYFNNQSYASPSEGSFPMNFNRLYNPPCTLRATGWNRFDYLFHDPQKTFETPFDWFIPSRDVDKQKCKSSPYTPRHSGPVEAFVDQADPLKDVSHGQVTPVSPTAQRNLKK